MSSDQPAELHEVFVVVIDHIPGIVTSNKMLVSREFTSIEEARSSLGRLTPSYPKENPHIERRLVTEWEVVE